MKNKITISAIVGIAVFLLMIWNIWQGAGAGKVPYISCNNTDSPYCGRYPTFSEIINEYALAFSLYSGGLAISVSLMILTFIEMRYRI